MVLILAVLEAEASQVLGPDVVLIGLVGEKQKVDVVILLHCRDVEWV